MKYQKGIKGGDVKCVSVVGLLEVVGFVGEGEGLSALSVVEVVQVVG